MSKRKNIYQLLFGNPEDNILEDQIPTILSFATATLSLVALTLNTIFGFPLIMIMIPLGASLAMYFVYYKLRFSKNKYFYKVMMAVVAFTYFNFLWYNNYGSSGPTLYLFLLFFIFLILIFDDRSRIVLTCILLVNIIVLFLLEFYASNITQGYAEEQTRVMDIYFSFFIYLAFTSIMALVIRYYYRLERSKAKKSDQLKSAFLSNMSHEIRTPMNAILGFSKLLEFTNSDEERNEYVNIINDNGTILIALLDDIMDMSKMDAGQFDIYLKPFELNNLMLDLGKVIRLSLDHQNKPDIKLNLIADENISVYSDENRLKQVLYNFLTNASKFTFQGEISYGFKVHNRDVEFFVSDTGIGIKEENFKDIFSRFYKVKSAEHTIMPRGAGIGLSISRVIVEKLGGRISFNSVYGKGSTFSFTLPSVIVESVPSPKKKVLSDVSFHGTCKVLVTEDDSSNMKVLTHILDKIGISFEVACDGAEALEVFKNHPEIDLVLMDINLPVMNGYEAMHELKRLSPALPVVALTAHAMNTDKENALTAGFDGYITKPIDQLALIECLKKHLSWQPAANA
jgi:signal transduction histidine kinase/CheY-like chemotaxis protein